MPDVDVRNVEINNWDGNVPAAAYAVDVHNNAVDLCNIEEGHPMYNSLIAMFGDAWPAIKARSPIPPDMATTPEPDEDN